MITTKTELASAIAECSLRARHLVPLLQAAYRDEVSLAAVPRGQTAPLGALDRARAPAVLLIGDDVADGLDPGPSGWPNLARVLRWARFVVINATGGYPEHYATFVEMARIHRKLVVVETGTARVCPWLAKCQAATVPTVVMQPSDGSLQPAMPRKEFLH